MRTEAFTLQQLTALSHKMLLDRAKKKASHYRRLNKTRKLTEAEDVHNNRVLGIIKLYERTFSEEKACK